MKTQLVNPNIQINEDDSYLATASKDVVVNGSSNVGFSNCSVGFGVYNKARRMGYGFNHYNKEQETLAMAYEQDGFRTVSTVKSTKELMPSNLRLRQNRHPVRDEACTNKALLDNTSRTALLSGRGQIRGFENPEKEVVKAIQKNERDIDTDKFGNSKAGFGQAGVSQEEQLKEAIIAERRHDKDAIKQEEVLRGNAEMKTKTIKADINEIKNF